MKRSKTALLKSAIALLLCISMFVGSTFAWFTDGVTSSSNIIQSGSLDLEMYWTDDLSGGTWHNVEDSGYNTIFDYDNWEPGYTDVRYIKLVNNGNLALNYNLAITPQGAVGKLAEVINVYFSADGVEVTSREDLNRLPCIGLLNNVMNGGATAEGSLLPAGETSPLHDTKETIVTIAMSMITTAGNEYQEKSVGDGFTITALATQCAYESDSFGNDYDSTANYPVNYTGGNVSASVINNGGVLADEVKLSGSGISATVPAGVKLNDGVDKITLSVTPLDETTTNITVINNEILIPVDVHVDGVSEDNTTPIIVDLGAILPKYLNMGNYHLYHVENGANSVMAMVSSKADLAQHNQFTYDPLTGEVSVAMASFSEVALFADTAAKWEGGEDYTWYNTTDTELQIANADQLYSFAKIVGGMANAIAIDSFAGKTVKLLSDINLNNANVVDDGIKRIFYPVGYYNTDDGVYPDKDNYDDKTNIAISSGLHPFEGTFDGNGHTISNIYQNTWEMKGDHDWYAPEDQHYRDGMGLFGKVYGGTVKNLTVDNFESDGEITTTGVIASYADFGATFENIAITNCNPRVYNIGNGGIVGCVGWYTKAITDKVITFKNITIDSTNKISALWGSYDVACGGIVGQYYPTSGQTSAGSPKNAGIHFENCHVSATMDVYNDVCANYQYYAYRYAGMIIGSIRENKTINGHVYPKMDGITAKGCTVHYDTWNDYYYCELVANSLASYTHDHQFSRLEQVSKVEGTTITTLKGNEFTVPNSGRYNYVVVNGEFTTENATCYHFVDGKVWNHADAGKETVNGVEVLKEDKQHIYLPFSQLFTGYGWGVTSKGIADYGGITTMDITQSSQKDSVEKFTSETDIDLSSIKAGDTVNVGDLFDDIKNPDVEIKDKTVMVAVTDLTKTGITADFTRGASWDQGTLKFNGTNGFVKITIQDYYFCKPTSVIVMVGQFNTTERFEVKFPNTDKYLYRVGNQNAISLSSLFTSVDNSVGNVSVDVETLNGNAATTYTSNDNWANGTLKFNGTGVVNITISDDNFSTPVTLPVEVVDAKNVAENGKIENYGTTSVLLGNTTVNTLYLNGRATLYGNGFTIDCKNAPINGTGSISENYIIELNDAHLDNVKIEGKVYTEYGAMASNDYNRALVVSKGNSSVTNCYLSNTASPIRLVSGNLNVKGTTVKGGNFANIDIRSGHLTLDNVTTINQKLGNDKADNEATVIGLGIVVYYELVNVSGTSITVKNGLNQYNYISSNDTFSNNYAQQFVSGMFDSTNSSLQYQNGSEKWVNSGIILMTDGITVTGAGDKTGVSFMSATGAVYTVKPTAENITPPPQNTLPWDRE